jgi:hypothetical protein
MYLKKQTLMFMAGAVWLIVGAALIAKGVGLMLSALHGKAALVGSAPVAMILLIVGMVVGMLKGRFALSRSAMRTIGRLSPMEGPVRLTQLYRIQDIVLIAAMVALGRILHLTHCPGDIHGFIDVAVGTGLVYGAVVYFRFAFAKTAS